jgi:hypothetical protein
MRNLAVRFLLPILTTAFLLTSSACNLTPTVGVGVGIPHTPVGVGVGVPLKRSGKAADVTQRPVIIESQPSGAELYINGQLAGSTPTTVQVPFTKGFWGQATGTARVVAKKPGYLAEGVQLYPASDGQVKTTPAGEAMRKVVIELRQGE